MFCKKKKRDLDVKQVFSEKLKILDHAKIKKKILGAYFFVLAFSFCGKTPFFFLKRRYYMRLESDTSPELCINPVG